MAAEQAGKAVAKILGSVQQQPDPAVLGSTNVGAAPTKAAVRSAVHELELCPTCHRNRTVGGLVCAPCEIAARGPDPDLIMGMLDMIGVNVPARGRYTLAEVCAMVSPDAADEARAFVQRVVDAGRWGQVQGVIFEGPTGVGKSLLVSAITRELLERRMLKPDDIRFDTSRGIWGLIRSGYTDGTAQREIQVRMRCRLWVLDDFGAEHATDDAGLNLTEILSARELRPTLMTANVPRDAQGDRWDPQVWDRIKSRIGDRNFRVVRMLGRDHRLEAPAA